MQFIAFAVHFMAFAVPFLTPICIAVAIRIVTPFLFALAM